MKGLESLPSLFLITDLAEIAGLKCVCFPGKCGEDYF
jgi:hypothetical protein